jgi:molecular chaperone DnaK
VKEAEEHAEEDRRKRDLIEERNKAESLLLTVERMLKESGEKVSADDRKTLEAAKKRLEEAREKATAAEEIRSAVEAFEKDVHGVTEKLYKAAAESPAREGAAPGGAAEGRAAGGGPRAGAGKGGGDEGVLDADFDVKS